MLDRARSNAGMDRVHWQQANALALPFSEHEFDCAIRQFGVMFFADKRTAFHETFRVLKQGGRFLFIVWDREEEVGIRSVAAEVMGRLLSRDPASLRPPPYFDLTAARADLEAAGFGAVSIEKLPERSRAKSPREAAIANCHGGICAPISSSTHLVASKRSPTRSPMLWRRNSVPDPSTPRCKPFCSPPHGDLPSKASK